jgi:hypothetical protein
VQWDSIDVEKTRQRSYKATSGSFAQDPDGCRVELIEKSGG